MRVLPALMAAGTAALAAYAWAKWQQRWTPDFELYTQGGIGLYPSPIGRLIGNLGETGFATLSALAAGVSVYCAALVRSTSFVTAFAGDAREHGSASSRIPSADLRQAAPVNDPRNARTYLLRLLAQLCDPIWSYTKCNETRRGWQASAVIVFSPVLLYLTFASADVIALGLYTAWLASSKHWLLTLGVFTHFALLPYALLHLALTDRISHTQKFVAGYFLGGTATIVLIVTPYGGIVFVDRGFWAAAGYGLILAALVSLPALIFFRPSLIHWLAFAVGAMECGLQNHAQARYFLPAILLLAATGRPRFGEVRTPSGGSYRFGLTPRPQSGMVGMAPGQGAAASRSSTRRLRHIQEEA